MWFLGPRFLEGEDAPNFGPAFQIELISEDVAGFGMSSVP